MVICPECESDLDIEEDEVDEGEIVSCPECGSDFEVVGVEPLELLSSRTKMRKTTKKRKTKRRKGISLSSGLRSTFLPAVALCVLIT